MKFAVQLLSCLAVCLAATLAHAQGGVINVGVTAGKLVVSNGIAESAGFADQMFVETDADGYGQDVPSLLGFGPAHRWTVPGVRIADMAVNSGLYIEALAVPDNTANPARDRVLWYWSGITNSLQDPPEDNHFLIYKTFAASGLYLASTDTTAPPKLKMASPVLEDLNVDTYGTYVKFALHKAVLPPVGVYAAFARLTSDQYEPSDPFLLTFNYGQLSASQLMTAALAINAAAVGSAGPANGDFNGDGIVDAADYTVWRNGLGSTYTPDHYDIWKSDFGQTFDGAGSGTSANVPEPAFQAPLALLAVLPWWIRGHRERHGRHGRRETKSRQLGQQPNFS